MTVGYDQGEGGAGAVQTVATKGSGDTYQTQAPQHHPDVWLLAR